MREQLEEVKGLINKYEECFNGEVALKYARDLMRYHAKWLIEQAKEVRRLREVNRQLNTLITQQGNRLWDAAEEINRLKAALKLALVGATHESCDHDDPDPAWHCCDWSETVKRIESVLKEVEGCQNK